MALPDPNVIPNLWDVGRYVVIVNTVGAALVYTAAGDYIGTWSLLNLGQLMSNIQT